VVVGEDETNGGLWCSPSANTSSPTSSALVAIATSAVIRSASLGARPVVGSGVTSLTEKTPNCMATSKLLLVQLLGEHRSPGGYARSTSTADADRVGRVVADSWW
jgi:hypothetical protein